MNRSEQMTWPYSGSSKLRTYLTTYSLKSASSLMQITYAFADTFSHINRIVIQLIKLLIFFQTRSAS